MRHTQSSRGLRRTLTLLLAGLVGVSGLTVHAGDAAQAATGTTPGRITIDEPNPLKEIILTAGSRMQLNSRTMGGNAFYGGATSPSAYPILLDLGTAKPMPLSATGTQTHGGAGTVGEPYWVETRGALQGAYSPFILTQRLSYVVGMEYVQNDLTLENTGPTATRVQLAQFADCFFQGSDNGLSAIEPGVMVQCLKDPNAMSLIAVSPEAKFAGGHYQGVRNALGKPFVDSADADRCWVSGTAMGACNLNVDNGFGIAWGLDIAPGERVTRSSYVSYTNSMSFVDLSVDAEVSQEVVELGEEITYALSVTNGGPDTADNVRVAFALPDGVDRVTDTGDYDPQAGVWSVPRLIPGETERLEITARPAHGGEFSTRITAVGSDGIDANPCQVTESCGPELTVFVDGSGVAAASTISAAPTEVRADGSASTTITVSAKRSDGEAATTGGARVTLASSLGTLSPVTDHSDGTYTAQLVSPRAGPAVVSFAMNGVDSPSTAVVNFLAGPADPENADTGFTVSEGERLVGEATHTVQVRLVDATGNPVAGEASQLVATTADPLGAGEVGIFRELADPGSYEALVSSTRAGAKDITVAFDGAAVHTTGNRTAVFVPGDVELTSPDTQFTVSDTEIVAGSGAHSIAVALADRFGNPVTGREDDLRAATSEPLGEGSVGAFQATGQPGAYEALVTSTSAGTKPMTVALDGRSVAAGGNDTARFIAGGVAETHPATGYQVSEGEASVSGGSHAVRVTLADAFGNPVTGEAAQLSAATTAPLGDGTVTEFGEAGVPGEYTATVTSTIAGDKPMVAGFAGRDLRAGDNVTARFVAGGAAVEHPNTRFSVTEGEREVGAEEHRVTVTLADAYGNPVSGQQAGLRASSDADLGGGAITEFTESAGAPGSYEAQIASTRAGAKPIDVTFGGDVLEHAGNREAIFGAGPVDLDPARTNYTVSEHALEVDSEPHTVTVTLADRYGNGIGDQLERLAAASPESLGQGVISSFTEAGAGTYTADISSTRSGSKPIVVSWGDEDLARAGNGAAEFFAGAPDPGHAETSFAVSEGERTVGTEPHTVTVGLADRFGNPASGWASELRVTTASELGGARLGVFLETSEVGVYGAEVPSYAAGAKLMGVDFQHRPLRSTGNDIARFVAGPVDLARTTLDAPDRLRADGRDSGPVTVGLFDGYGNPSDAAETVEITISLGELGDHERPSPGAVRAELSSADPGIARVGVVVDGDAAPVTATVEFVQDAVPGAAGERDALPLTGAPAAWGGGALGLLLLSWGAWLLHRARRTRATG